MMPDVLSLQKDLILATSESWYLHSLLQHETRKALVPRLGFISPTLSFLAREAQAIRRYTSFLLPNKPLLSLAKKARRCHINQPRK